MRLRRKPSRPLQSRPLLVEIANYNVGGKQINLAKPCYEKVQEQLEAEGYIKLQGCFPTIPLPGSNVPFNFPSSLGGRPTFPHLCLFFTDLF